MGFLNNLTMLESSDLIHASTLDAKKIQHDGEDLPFPDNSFDCITSTSLHWTNDLPGVFAQIKAKLKDDGCLIAAIVGGDSLYELRGSMQLAEQSLEGGVGVHVSPMVQVSDVGI
jgi:NADH dehydrogenase [ubiquinone] 1 alpha subcomplex assembly factor 5